MRVPRRLRPTNGLSLTSNSAFGATADVYEADQDLGDVLPPSKKLEQHLFGGDRSRPGNFMEQLTLTAAVDGPVQIEPTLEVS